MVGCEAWISQDCEKRKGSPSFMFGEPLFEEQSIVLESKPLCCRINSQTKCNSEKVKARWDEESICVGGKSCSLHH